MPITSAKVIGESQRLGDLHTRRGCFGTAGYTLTGRSLHQIDRCPAAWHRLGHEEDTHVGVILEAIWTLMVMPSQVQQIMAVRPEKIERPSMVCPRCQSANPAKHCRACDTDRVLKMVSVGWSKNIAECRAWEEHRAALGHVLISTADWERALAATSALSAPPHINAMLGRAKRGVLLAGRFTTEAGEKSLVAEHVLAVPAEDATDSDCIYLLATSTSSQPGSVETALEWHGLATRGALALDLHNAATHEGRRKVRVLVAGISPDAEPSYIELSPAALNTGRRTYIAGLTQYQTAVESSNWPGHDHDGKGNIAWRTMEVMHS